MAILTFSPSARVSKFNAILVDDALTVPFSKWIGSAARILSLIDDYVIVDTRAMLSISLNTNLGLFVAC